MGNFLEHQVWLCDIGVFQFWSCGIVYATSGNGAIHTKVNPD